MANKAGKLYVFEGPDGVGKSTLATWFSECLRERGMQCAHLSFPGREDGTLGKLVYELHHQPHLFCATSPTETARQLLHIAAHIDVIERKILPLLAAGTNVVLDRFWWSTLVYGQVLGANEAALRKMVEVEQVSWEGVLPERVFLVSRTHLTETADDQSLKDKLARCYRAVAEKERKHYPVILIDNDEALIDAQAKIAATVKFALLPAKDKQSDSAKSTQFSLGFLTQNKKEDGPTIVSKIAPAVPTVVFDTYWKFATERQRIFFNRVEGKKQPWTDDPILIQHKFTNAYRASDRVSQYLIRNVIYQGDQSAIELLFRILLFKIFNKIETWEWLVHTVGPISFREYSFQRYDQALKRAMGAGTAIYSAAYIMPSAGAVFGCPKKHSNHLKLIEKMIGDGLASRLRDCRSMQQAYELLLGFPSIGGFLAYQYVTDINYSNLTQFSETEFVVPGPGAKDGIRKCFSEFGGLNESEIIRWMMDHQEEEFERLGLPFRDLWTRRLQLIDCQNIFCEVDKYARVAHPQVAGLSGRTRIKQSYKHNAAPIDLWYPPKWGINKLIHARGKFHDRDVSISDSRSSVVAGSAAI
ncbi:MAG: nucleotide kinase domain-containing protein [Phycisphaerae bacterium]